MPDQFVIGIDPGVHGAVAVLRASFDQPLAIITAFDLPLAKAGAKQVLVLPEIVRRLRPFAGVPCFIEAVHAAPGQGVSSMFRFGHAAGALEGIATALACQVTPLTPQAWQKIVRVAADPDAGRHRASQLFPAEAYRFFKKKDHNVADAVLIALAGVRLVQPHRHAA